ncbi:hypothetical protein ACLOJK_018275 [Asimina triloba]
MIIEKVPPFFLGFSGKLCGVSGNSPLSCCSINESYVVTFSPDEKYQLKKRKISHTRSNPSCRIFNDLVGFVPVLRVPDYFMKPSLEELAERGVLDENYCSRVRNFTVGRVGYGYVKFLGETDVRWLDLDQIVKFNRHEVVVYLDEHNKPLIGRGLNKAAEVTLIIQAKLLVSDRVKHDKLLEKLRSNTEKQGARFISFDASTGEWKFLVRHFSRFGLNQDDEDDIVMEDASVQQPTDESHSDELEVEKEPQLGSGGTVLSHSLPAHLGLDPVKMQEMRMMMFPSEEESEDMDMLSSHEKLTFGKAYVRGNASPNSKVTLHKSPLQSSAPKASHRRSLSPMPNAPIGLLEYKPNVSTLKPPGTILMTRQTRGMPLRTTKVEGFKLELKHETPIANSHSSNIVDAALFMGRSFRVGWGPNGILVHTGAPVGSPGIGKTFSSVVNIEKVAMDRVVRDENNKVKEELVDFCFTSPLNLHKSISHESKDVEVGSFKLKLQKIVSSPLMLSEICQGYIEIIERQIDVPGLARSVQLLLFHQVMVWELIKVLFSAKEISGYSQPADVNDGEDMMDEKDGVLDIDPEAYTFSRRANFSSWLQESVCHRVQQDVSCLGESSDLEHIFFLLTGRQLDTAVELSASRGDVRLACLLSQAGGSMVSRSDMARQLELWRINGLDFNFIENNRLKLYELLAGNIQGALQDSQVDWKRYLGLLMWYQLPPDTSLLVIIGTYQRLLNEGKAPYPVPIYIDEGPLEEAPNWSIGGRFDLSYYLMLLHANEEKAFEVLKTMFSAFSSTHDALDYHMIWHQRAVLEAVGAFSSDDLHLLDMSLVSQLLSVGLCHWAIYVVLHMPYCEDFPYLHANIIREILFQYCESWSRHEMQRQFIEDLGIPSAWMHEALAIHSKHSEILRLAIAMQEHKSEIAEWDLGAGLYIDFFYIKGSLLEEVTMTKKLVLLDGWWFTFLDDLLIRWVVKSSIFVKVLMSPNAIKCIYAHAGASMPPDTDIRSHAANSNLQKSMDSLEKKTDECRNFFDRLNKSLSVWGSKLPLAASIRVYHKSVSPPNPTLVLHENHERGTYSKMAEEICSLLLSDGGEGCTREAQMSCFETILKAPVPEDRRSCHLQDAVSVFTLFLTERAT